MKVYDCFTFYNEFELLELRLKSLSDVVDYFVIVEANRTHNNQPKKYNLERKAGHFKKYINKIRYIMFEADKIPYKGTGDWSIENAQRNAIVHGLHDAKQEDLICISDLDEIPDPNILKNLNDTELLVPYKPSTDIYSKPNVFIPCRSMITTKEFLNYYPLVMEQKMHAYYLNMSDKKPWTGTILVKYKNLTTPQELRNSRNNLPRILNGGWHFSYMGGINKIIDKINAIVEGKEFAETLSLNITDNQHIEKCISIGKDIYNRKGYYGIECSPCNIEDIKLPYIKEFIQKYPQFINSKLNNDK